ALRVLTVLVLLLLLAAPVLAVLLLLLLALAPLVLLTLAAGLIPVVLLGKFYLVPVPRGCGRVGCAYGRRCLPGVLAAVHLPSGRGEGRCRVNRSSARPSRGGRGLNRIKAARRAAGVGLPCPGPVRHGPGDDPGQAEAPDSRLVERRWRPHPVSGGRFERSGERRVGTG